TDAQGGEATIASVDGSRAASAHAAAMARAAADPLEEADMGVAEAGASRPDARGGDYYEPRGLLTPDGHRRSPRPTMKSCRVARKRFTGARPWTMAWTTRRTVWKARSRTRWGSPTTTRPTTTTTTSRTRGRRASRMILAAPRRMQDRTPRRMRTRRSPVVGTRPPRLPPMPLTSR